MTGAQRARLEGGVRKKKTPQRQVLRARICLLAAEGMSNSAIARELGTTRPTVILWRQRFMEQGEEGLQKDAPKPGRPRRITGEQVKEMVETTLHRRPAAATHWSTRSLAKAAGVSHMTVQRVWKAHGLQPHRVKTFKLSKDQRFVEKLTDVVGLYLNPPEHALVLCVDEKSQVQALDRTQPGLPMKKGRCGTMTHDYKRHGTTCLFAALEVLTGKVIGECHPRHRHQEFLKFLRRLDRETPAELDLHLIVDNYSTHKHEKVKKWLGRRRRFHFHFIPTGSSWLNLVERWFREITQKRIRRGSFRSVPELVSAIEEYLRVNNESPKPFVWTKRADEILAKVNHCKAIYDTLH